MATWYTALANKFMWSVYVPGGAYWMTNVCRLLGVVGKADFHQAKHALEVLSGEYPEQFVFGGEQCVPMMEYQWEDYVENLRKSEVREIRAFTGNTAVFCNDDLIGGADSFLQWAAYNYNYCDNVPRDTYEGEARTAYSKYFSNPERAYVFMDVCIEGDLIGRLTLELYKNLCPQTCANFVALCTGEKGHAPTSNTRLSYVNSIFHRIVPNGWIQGGDIYEGSGANGESIFGKHFPDESFALSHGDSSGIIGMANHGRNTNNSQFYITLKPSPWMDKQYVAFGRVIEGRNVLKKLEQVETYNDRPLKLCQVSNCGIVTVHEDDSPQQ